MSSKPRAVPFVRAMNSMVAPLVSVIASSPFVRLMVCTSFFSSWWRESVKYLTRRLNAFLTVFTRWAVCRMCHPQTARRSSSYTSRAAFFPFWRGTSRPHTTYDGLPDASHAHQSSITSRCHGYRFIPTELPRAAASSASVYATSPLQ